MSLALFNINATSKEKPIIGHPWTSTIKNKYSNKIKYAHNSIKNINYPIERKKRLSKDRTHFTIIGNRLHKDFIYCVKFVKELHKYRRKYFDAPAIHGVTGVEWPYVWNQLKIEHGGIAFCLPSPLAVLINKNLLGGIHEFKALIEAKYIDNICLDYYREGVVNFASFIRASGLYADLVPFTCENFLRLCKEQRGGYSGTPVHRIVKDGWIQCGGFKLKSTALDCENFIIPFDRRGVLAMANDGRHVDCSTQFFVLLQPSTWMEHKYVAFGQLIDGVDVLKTIENVPNVYESPTSNIVMYQTGILNLECHDIMINKNANEYIHGHIEDLIALGDILFEELMEKVFLEIDISQKIVAEGSEEEESNQNVRETQRFIRKKEEIQSQLVNRNSVPVRQPLENIENNDFDVDEYAYEYEAEESMAKHDVSLEPSLVVKPEKSFYIPLTDVPYPGEVDSTFDLKRFLKGDFCLESDLEKPKKLLVEQKRISHMSEILQMEDESDLESDEESLDSDEERQITRYLKQYADHVSFTGKVVRRIARGHEPANVFVNLEKCKLLTDETLRKINVMRADLKQAKSRETRVLIHAPSAGVIEKHNKIKRRQTGFVHPQDLQKICGVKSSSEQYDSYAAADGDDDGTTSARKVRIAADSAQIGSSSRGNTKPPRRPTGFSPTRLHYDSDIDEERQSVLVRLYKQVSQHNEAGPTLKDYRPLCLDPQKNPLLTYSSNSRMKRDGYERDQFLRKSYNLDSSSYDRVMTIQHGRKIVRKISSDYVKTIDQIEHQRENTFRTIEYAKTRPTLTISEYQMKNQKYKEENEMKDGTR